MQRLTSIRTWEEASQDLANEPGYSYIWQRLNMLENIISEDLLLYDRIVEAIQDTDGRKRSEAYRTKAREAMKKRPQCSCFLPIDPPRTTHQQKKVAVVHGKPVIYQPSRLKNAVSVLGWSLAPHKPKEPLKGPLALVVRWKFHGQKKKPGWKVTRPDTDNLQKALKDEMGKLGFYQDDAQVVHEECEKVWADVPGIEIKLWELEP